MPNTHAICNTMHTASWDIDSFNEVGICASDVDNGTMLTLGAITKTGNAVTGYQHTVTLPVANATGLYIARTPIPGSSNDLEMHFYSDPRYFYNKAGEPIHLAYLQAQVDVIEVTGEAFATGNTPVDQPAYTFASVDTNGKFVVANAAPAQGTYFEIEGQGYVDIGQEIVTTYIMRCKRN